MATVLDFSILGSLSTVFVFISIFVGGWGLTAYLNPFKLKDDKKNSIYAVLMMAVTFIIILSPSVLSLIKFMIPWLSIIMLIAFFMLFFTMMFNPDFKGDKLIQKPVVYGFLIAFTAIIFFFGMGQAFGQGLLEEQPGVTDADRIQGDTTPADSFVPVDEFQNEQEISTANSVGDGPASGSFSSNLILTLFHPKILGMFFMLVLGTITILLIAR